LQAIQLIRSSLGITETKDIRSLRLRKALRNVNHEKRRQIPASLRWEDLSPLARSVLLGLLGDGGVYEANETHYYSETHKLSHKDYLTWKISLLLKEFRGSFREHDPHRKDARCVWETGVSQIFSLLREQFYTRSNVGFKTIMGLQANEWMILGDYSGR
jgi:hypothetical protein